MVVESDVGQFTSLDCERFLRYTVYSLPSFHFFHSSVPPKDHSKDGNMKQKTCWESLGSARKRIAGRLGKSAFVYEI